MTDSDQNLTNLSAASWWILSKFNHCQEAVKVGVQTLELANSVEALYRFLWDDYASWYVEYLKTDNSDLVFAKTLFGHFTVLISPFAPFVAESLWTNFFDLSQNQTLAQLTKEQTTDMLSPLPVIPATSDSSENHQTLIQEFSDLVSLIREIRSIRGLFGIDPGLTLTVITNNRKLPAYSKFLQNQAKCQLQPSQVDQGNLEKAIDTKNYENLEIKPTANQSLDNSSKTQSNSQATNFFAVTSGQFTIQIDLMAQITSADQQIAKANKELESLQKQIQVLQKQLANPDFVSRAEPEIIQDKKDSLVARQLDIDSQQQKIGFLQKFARSAD